MKTKIHVVFFRRDELITIQFFSRQEQVPAIMQYYICSSCIHKKVCFWCFLIPQSPLFEISHFNLILKQGNSSAIIRFNENLKIAKVSVRDTINWLNTREEKDTFFEFSNHENKESFGKSIKWTWILCTFSIQNAEKFAVQKRRVLKLVEKRKYPRGYNKYKKIIR